MRRGTTAGLATALALAVVPAAGAQDGTGTISGQVTAADGGAGIDDVCVDALPLGEDAEEATTRTAADGTYTLSVAEGLYLLAFNGCVEPRAGYVGSIHGFEDDGDPVVEVVAGGTTDVDAALATAGTITGRVTEEGTGRALADVCVQSQTEEAYLPATARTAEDGTYAITTAMPGETTVSFIGCEGPRLHTPEVYADTPIWPITEDEIGDPVTVTAEATTNGIDASLALGGVIEGSVELLHTGSPPPFAIVGGWAAGDTDEIPTAIALAGFPGFGVGFGVGLEPDEATAGQFELPGLPPDSYRLELQPAVFGVGEQTGWRERWYERAETRAAATPIEVAAGEVADGIVLELVPTSSIEPMCDGSQSNYPDVRQENVHATAIGCMTDAGVVRGGTDGRYRPAEAVRRDQMASFLARLLQWQLGSPSGDMPDAFSDDDGNVHEANIDFLAFHGIVEGDGTGRYRPEGLVGRGQMATYLARAYEAATGATLRTPATSFGDVEGTAHATSIRKVAVAAIAAGTSASAYEPNQPVAREQMATFMARLHTRMFLDTGVFFYSSGSGSSSAETSAPASEGSTLALVRAALAAR